MSLFDINGNPILTGGGGGSDSFFELLPEPIGIGGTTIDAMPTGWASEGNWIFGSNGSVIGNLSNGKTEGNSVGFAYNKPFTGTVYLRGFVLATGNYSNDNSYSSYMIIADDENAINNPTYDTMSCLLGERTELFTIDGAEQQQFIVRTDGTYEQRAGTYVNVNDVTNGYGVISVQKFEIPEGKVGYICTQFSGALWLAGWNAVFSYDISSNPVIAVDENLNSGTRLEVMESYESGFMKSIAQSPYFKLFFKDRIEGLLSKTHKLPTFGKSLYIGGDSLHQYSGGDGKYTSGFATNYNKYFGFKTLVNHGYAGSTWTDTTGGGGIKRVTDLVTAGVPYDVFILAWGTNNDAGGNGTINDEASNAEGCTMVAAMKWCITQLRTTYRYSAIGVIIPPPKITNEGMKERGDLMIQVCDQLHVPYVDMRKYLSIDDLSSDGVHLGYGANKYGAAEAKLILDICPYGDPLR